MTAWWWRGGGASRPRCRPSVTSTLMVYFSLPPSLSLLLSLPASIPPFQLLKISLSHWHLLSLRLFIHFSLHLSLTLTSPQSNFSLSPQSNFPSSIPSPNLSLSSPLGYFQGVRTMLSLLKADNPQTLTAVPAMLLSLHCGWRGWRERVEGGGEWR